MRYYKLGPSNIEVSVVSLGTWVLGGDNWGKTDDRQSIATIETAIDSGINLIDTAPAYGRGHAEEIVGKAIQGKRDHVYIATKCGLKRKGRGFEFDLKPSEIRKELENSLLRMKIEHIDIYQCHWPDPKTPIESTLEEMLKMQAEGKINFIGVSNFDIPLLKRTVKAASIVSIQPQYSLLERTVEKDILPFCRKEGIGIMTYGSLGSGLLTGKYKKLPTFKKSDARSFFYQFYKSPCWERADALIAGIKKIAKERKKPVAQVAINWVAQQQGITTAIVGARTPEQAEMNALSGEWELNPEDLAKIDSFYQESFF